MSLGACIPGLVADGTISEQRGQRMLKLYDELVAGYRRQMGGPAAEAAATEKALEQLTKDAALKKYRAGLTTQVQGRMAIDMASFKGGDADGPVHRRAAEAVIVHDDRAPYMSLEYLWKAIRGRAQAGLDQILVKHRADLLGRIRDPRGFDQIVDAMHGAKVADLNAREVADAALKSLEELRLRANAAGADIGKLENHGLPHSHDARRIDDAGFLEWRDYLKPLLDRSRMIDRETGAPMTDEVLDTVLADVFGSIVTDGWSTRAPGGIGRPALANRLGDHRFLHFTDGAAWRAYNDRFGMGSPYDALMNHVDRLSRDIALMETLGPNPGAGLKWLQDTLVKDAAIKGDRKQRAAADKGARTLQAYYDTVIGTARDPFDRRIATAFSAIRSWEVATKLGGATLSATSDLATQALTRGFNGLPQISTLSSYVKFLNPADAADRAHAIRSGLIADGYAQRATAQGRMMGEELVGEIPRRVAEGVLKLSGLEAVTQAGRWAFGMDFISALTMYRGQAFGELNSAFRRMFERYGLDAAAWDKIRATPLAKEGGGEWLQPIDIADRKLGDRVLAMIQAETDFAVPTGGLEISAWLNTAFRSGTLLGELGRTAFQFKAFPVTITMMHARRMMATSSWQGRAGYLAALMALTTVAGAAALQMKELAKGRDARPMDNWQFWGAAGAQGGGLGIYGDFLKGSQSRFGSDFTDVLKGPAYQTADTLNALTLGAAGAALDPEQDVNYGARVSRALKGEVPGGSLWYGRLAFERLVLDQLQEQIDPEFRQSWRRMEMRALETDQRYYWRPGETAPLRTPELGSTPGGAE